MTIVEIYKDLVLIESYLENPIILSIESEEVAKSFKEQFEMLWKSAKKWLFSFVYFKSSPQPKIQFCLFVFLSRRNLRILYI